MDNKAQISAELIIILAAVIAIVLLLVTRLRASATKASSTIGDKSDSIFQEIEKLGKDET
jgi:uncharacterized protein (UPF0333 family)